MADDAPTPGPNEFSAESLRFPAVIRLDEADDTLSACR
jgi:hypothetical protein